MWLRKRPLIERMIREDATNTPVKDSTTRVNERNIEVPRRRAKYFRKDCISFPIGWTDPSEKTFSEQIKFTEYVYLPSAPTVS